MIKNNLAIKILPRYRELIRRWVSHNYLNIAIFNLVLMVLILLHTARYFDPYWLISINTIIFISLVMAVLLLHADSKVLFLVTLLFWLVALIIRLFGIEVWAERVSIYVFQSLFLGMVLLVIEKNK